MNGGMGLAKARFMRGLCSVEGSVCGDCLGDPGLAAFVGRTASELRCDFCGRQSESEPIAARVDDVVEHMQDCIGNDYEDPNESVGWCSGEGGWIGVEPLSTYELLSEELGLDLPNDSDGKLFEALCKGLDASREWVRIDPYGPAPEQRYMWSWDRFCRVLRHQRRFFFLDHAEDDVRDDLLSPRRLLQRLLEFCVSHGLVRPLPTGSRIYRVRHAKRGEHLTTPLELGPPRDGSSFPSRMSAAGIPMFYGAGDPETALRETWHKSGVYVIAHFEVTQNKFVLDLADVPPIPSIFEGVSDSAEGDPRHELMFLHQFAREVSRPIDREDRAHIDYVPTQVVAEYFRSARLQGGRQLDGIRYRSAEGPPGICYALFTGCEGVEPSAEDLRRFGAAAEPWRRAEHDGAWLRLVASSERVVPRRPGGTST